MKTTQRFGKGVATGALLSASVLTMGQAFAQDPWTFSANIGAVSNYIWRGVTQTDDQPAIQGGLDVAHDSGFYAGTWASNVDFGEDGANYELDFYAGYDFTLPVEDASLGLNTIYYAYPDGGDIDFWEIGISGGYKWLSLGIQYTAWGDEANEDTLFDEGDFYYSASLDFPLPQDFGLSIFGGYYDFDDDQIVVGVREVDGMLLDVTEGADYGHWGATISKEAGEFGTFSFTYEQNDGDTEVGYDNDAKVWVGWLKEF